MSYFTSVSLIKHHCFENMRLLWFDRLFFVLNKQAFCIWHYFKTYPFANLFSFHSIWPCREVPVSDESWGCWVPRSCNYWPRIPQVEVFPLGYERGSVALEPCWSPAVWWPRVCLWCWTRQQGVVLKFTAKSSFSQYKCMMIIMSGLRSFLPYKSHALVSTTLASIFSFLNFFFLNLCSPVLYYWPLSISWRAVVHLTVLYAPLYLDMNGSLGCHVRVWVPKDKNPIWNSSVCPP